MNPFKEIISGELLQRGRVMKNLPFLLYLTFLMLLYIGYGYYVDNHDITPIGFKALPIEVMLEKPGTLGASHLRSGSIGRFSVRTSFTANKKRISGRI